MDMYFPLGLEEEFQLIDSESYQLRSYIHPLLKKATLKILGAIEDKK